MEEWEKAAKDNGDDTMEKVVAERKGLNLDLILGKGSVMATQEALEDVNPVSWSEDILNGKKKAIIKSKET